MIRNFNYALVIATDSFKDKLGAALTEFSQVQGLEVYVVANGKNSVSITEQYRGIPGLPSNAKIMTSPDQGKSVALNYFLRNVGQANLFLIFTDDDVLFPKENITRYISVVEQKGRGYYYGGGVDVLRDVDLPNDRLKLYPESIRGIEENQLEHREIFLGCNWGAFAEDIIQVGGFNPYFGPGSITGSVGQESYMMKQLVAAGIRPSPIYDCRVTHHAPSDYHEEQWLYKRRYREGIQRGLLRKKGFLKTLLKKTLGIFQRDKVKRRANVQFAKGMIYSMKYLLVNVERN